MITNNIFLNKSFIKAFFVCNISIQKCCYGEIISFFIEEEYRKDREEYIRGSLSICLKTTTTTSFTEQFNQ